MNTEGASEHSLCPSHHCTDRNEETQCTQKFLCDSHNYRGSGPDRDCRKCPETQGQKLGRASACGRTGLRAAEVGLSRHVARCAPRPRACHRTWITARFKDQLLDNGILNKNFKRK